MTPQQAKNNLLSATTKIIESPWTLPVSLAAGLMLGQQVLVGVVSIYLLWFFFGRAPRIETVNKGKKPIPLSSKDSPFWMLHLISNAAPLVLSGVAVLVLIIIIGHRLGD